MDDNYEKMLNLRTAQYKILHAQGIDLLYILKIYEKFEKNESVSEGETALYNKALRALRKENSADVFLNKYYQMSDEEMQVVREKFKDTVREFHMEGRVEKKEEKNKDEGENAGFHMKSVSDRALNESEKRKPGERERAKRKARASEHGFDGKAKRKIWPYIIVVLVVGIILYAVFGGDEKANKIKELEAQKAKTQQVQKPPPGK